MPGQLLNMNIDKLSDGVSQQYDESRFPSQVAEMVNCMPTISRGVLRRNPVRNAFKLPYIGLEELTDVYTYAYDRGTGDEQYLFVILQGGLWRVYNVHSGEMVGNGFHRYLQVPSGEKLRDSFDMLTVGDHTFVVNKHRTVTMNSLEYAPGQNEYMLWAFYWIKKTTAVTMQSYSVGDTDFNDTGHYVEGYTYKLNDGSYQGSVTGKKDTRPGYTPIDDLDAYKIAQKMSSFSPDWNTGGTSSAFVYKKTGSNRWEWEDTFGNEASLGVWKTVDSIDRLPAQLPAALDGFICKVSGSTGSEMDDYYVKYSLASETWIEVVKPGTKIKLDEETMPHVFYALVSPIDASKRRFLFDTYQGVSDDGKSLDGITKWGERTSGDEDTNPDPSFVGRQITSMFFYRNRLGFISDDSIVLSSTGDYGNFFATTVQEVYEDDPIDISVASTNVTVLHHAVPTAGGLLLFSDDSQFIMSPGNQTLTPNTANIVALSNYTYNPTAPAVSIGDKVYFSSISGGWAEIFTYKMSSATDLTGEATPLTLHLPHYIPSSIFQIVGHSVKGFVFFNTHKDNNIYVLSTQSIGGQDIQNAFHKWEFMNDIVAIHIINNDLFILFKNGILGSITLEIPKYFSSIIYADDTGGTVLNSYRSYIDFSKFFVRTEDTKGSPRGRTQIRTIKYVVSKDSHYETKMITTNIVQFTESDVFYDDWDDTWNWDDTYIWYDDAPYYFRVYKDDPKITVSGNTDNIRIRFMENEDYPDNGFELQMLNVEAYYFDRSRRIA